MLLKFGVKLPFRSFKIIQKISRQDSYLQSSKKGLFDIVAKGTEDKSTDNLETNGTMAASNALGHSS